jgi:hypothetical protein
VTEHNGDVGRHGKVRRQVPARLIDQEHGVGARGDDLGDFDEMQGLGCENPRSSQTGGDYCDRDGVDRIRVPHMGDLERRFVGRGDRS